MADVHIKTDAPTDEELVMMRDMMNAFIFPNVPTTDDEKAAFEKAVVYQIDHQKTFVAQCGDTNLPQGVNSFSIGDFSMSFDKNMTTAVLTKKTICPYAYGVLLRAGLLYKGVDVGGCGTWL